ncbi:MAG: hypothetical protein M3Q42_08310 [Pseudomonadota bacterium]|nr:hypothetical protein [Pseudomonadota bacterium]
MHAEQLSLDDRMTWAALAAVVGAIHDGPEVATESRLFARLEAACRSFGVPRENFDQCAKLMDFHYYRPWDCYVGKDELSLMEQPARGCGVLH